MAAFTTSPFPFSSPIRDTGASVTARVRGGLTVLRPLGPGEHEPLAEVFDAMSADSRYSRYLTGLIEMPAGMRRALTAVDGCDHVAWLASIEGRPAGIGRYVRTAPGTVEMAFEVVDAHQRRGLGTVLVDVLSTVAAVSGVRRVEATVLPSNKASLRLLEQIGLSFHTSAGQLEGLGELQLLDPPRIDRPAVARLALAAAAGPIGSLSACSAAAQ
ncbi:MAG: GNAT family N-acetyltransferase [Marmoricola sp.]